MSSNIRRNLSFQIVYQILNTFIPLITAPYLARVLGASQLGVFSFTSSIVAYFTLCAMLGTVNYGTRSIAAVKDNIEERSRTFWSVYLLQVIASIISITVYLIYLTFFCKYNIVIAEIQIFALISCTLDISWLFFGMENLGPTVSVNMVFRIISVVAIFAFVKKPEDLWIYAVIMLVGTLFGQIVLWVYVPKYVKFVKISFASIIVNVRPNILLFIPLLAMSIYHTMDKTMLGVLGGNNQSGFYYNVDKIINIPLCIINGIGTVMLPRMTSLYNAGNRKDGDELFVISLEGVSAVSVAMAFGITAISQEFIPFFLGTGYEDCVALTVILSPVLIIKGFSNTVRIQYLVPLKMEDVFTKSVISGAIVNLIMNYLLIPKLGAMGAVLGTLLAELVSCIWQFISIRKFINLRKCFINCGIYVIAGVCMLSVVRICALLSLPAIVKLAIEIGVGGFIYTVACVVFWKITKNKMFRTILGSYRLVSDLEKK